jgi:hypothetical protein
MLNESSNAPILRKNGVSTGPDVSLESHADPTHKRWATPKKLTFEPVLLCVDCGQRLEKKADNHLLKAKGNRMAYCVSVMNRKPKVYAMYLSGAGKARFMLIKGTVKTHVDMRDTDCLPFADKQSAINFATRYNNGERDIRQ